MQLSSQNVHRVVEQPADAPQLRPRLSDFIDSHAEETLVARDEFAATVSHECQALDAAALRDDASEIPRAIAADLPPRATGRWRQVDDRLHASRRNDNFRAPAAP